MKRLFLILFLIYCATKGFAQIFKIDDGPIYDHLRYVPSGARWNKLQLTYYIDPGGILKITNGGVLSPIIDDTHTFEVPQGAILQIEQGDIKKSAVVFPSSSELNYLCPCETE